MPRLKPTTYTIATLVLILAAILVGGGLYVLSADAGRDANARARAIVDECKKEGGDPANCYERRVPELYPELSVPELFDIVRGLRLADPSYQFCHVLAHKIGERLVAENPDGWARYLALNPADSLCSNGFIHGVVGGRFRSDVLDERTIESLIPDFSSACEPKEGWTPSDFDRATCYHGMGHLYDFITDADLSRAVTLCERTAPEPEQRVCTQGVFMQIYQPLEPDDFELIKRMQVRPSTTTTRAFCARYDDPMSVGSCRSESWPYFRDGILEGSGAQSFCADYPNATEEDYCWGTISAIVGRMSLDDVEKAVRACTNFPVQRQDECFNGASQAVLEENRTDAQKAVAVCRRAPAGLQDPCLSTLLSHARFLFGNNRDQFDSFCTALGPSYADSCARHRPQ